jgi:hypothetical protein
VAPEHGGEITQYEFTKHFRGDLEGSSIGVMLSGGDPQAGQAGYVAMERVSARLDQRTGIFALQHFGVMEGGIQTVECEVVPGSGAAELSGINGRLSITVDAGGLHHYELIANTPTWRAGSTNSPELGRSGSASAPSTCQPRMPPSTA